MKITLTETLIDSLSTLPQESVNHILNTCRELISLDNDAIEQYELPDDAPQPLRDIVANMQKRAAAARRRRERQAAKTAKVAENNTVETPSAPIAAPASPTIDPEYAAAITLLFSDTAIDTTERCALMNKLIVYITERINPSSQPAPVPETPQKKSRRKRRKRNRRRH